MQTVVLYWSKTGNTQKVAEAITEGLEEAGVGAKALRIEDAAELDWFDYDLVCLGFPSYQWHPPKSVVDYLQDRFASYRGHGRVKTGAPKLPGRQAFIFCTYSGPHTGIDEAIPAGKYAGQFFAHLGFTVNESYVVGEFHGSEERSTEGPLGDIRGRPDAADLARIRRQVVSLVSNLKG
jgi:hypothetical protein